MYSSVFPRFLMNIISLAQKKNLVPWLIIKKNSSVIVSRQKRYPPPYQAVLSPKHSGPSADRRISGSTRVKSRAWSPVR